MQFGGLRLPLLRVEVISTSLSILTNGLSSTYVLRDVIRDIVSRLEKDEPGRAQAVHLSHFEVIAEMRAE